MIAARIVLAYALVSVFATSVNLACQFAVVHLYGGPYAIPFSVAVGTVVGLPVKYALDKLYIFGFPPDSLLRDRRAFLFYGSAAVATTVVFWSTEFIFDSMFRTEAMRYLGGAIGLALGYAMKFQLDSRYVFRRAAVARRWSA